MVARWCKKHTLISEHEYPILIYGLQVICNTSLKISAILLIGICTGHVCEVMISMAIFCSMRYWTGGYHCKTHIGCFAVMLVMCLLPAFLMKVQSDWIMLVWCMMGAGTFYMILRYAPVNSKVNPINSLKKLRQNRIMSIVECVMLLGMAYMLRNSGVAWLIIFPLWVDGLLLLLAV